MQLCGMEGVEDRLQAVTLLRLPALLIIVNNCVSVVT